MGILNEYVYILFCYYSTFIIGLVTEMEDYDEGVHPLLSAHFFLTTSFHNSRPSLVHIGYLDLGKVADVSF